MVVYIVYKLFWKRDYYFIPRVPMKLIYGYCILSIHQRRNPETPHPPTGYTICYNAGSKINRNKIKK